MLMRDMYICLSDLKPGESGVVTGFAKKAFLRRRLQDLGIIAGTPIHCIGKSPLGDPQAYLVRRTVIALRKKDAAQIFVREVA